MAIKGLDHINISTVRLAETRDFFIDVMGLTEGWRPTLAFNGAWLYAGDEAVVHLAEVDAAPKPSRGAALDHFAFAIDDYDGMKARLDARGITYRELKVPGKPIRQLFFSELNGATIELNCREG